jgi:hypothetical protein
MSPMTTPYQLRATLNRALFAALLVLIPLCTRPAAASVIYSDFGPSDTFSTLSYLTMSGGQSSGPYHYDWAMAFTSSGDYALDAIRLPLGLVSGAPSDLYLSLAANDNGFPGAILESWTLSAIGPINGPLTTASSVLHPILMTGATYWIAADAPVTSSAVFQWNASPSAWGFHAMRYNEGNWIASSETPYGAFDVNATPAVPEPATLMLLGSGTAALAWRRRRSAR